jgi:hypothetical protein
MPPRTRASTTPTRTRASTPPKTRVSSKDGKKDTLLARYQSLLARQPLAVNITQSGLLAAAGNVTAQLIKHGVRKRARLSSVANKSAARAPSPAASPD